MVASRFRISLASGDLLDMERSQFIQLAAESGFDAIELACQEPHLALGTARRDRTLIQLELRIQDLEVSSFALETCFTNTEQALRSRNMVIDFIAIAHSYNAPVLCLTAGGPRSLEATFGHWETLVEYLTPCVVAAERRGLRLAIETRRNTLTDTIDSTLRLLDRFDSTALGVALDPCELALNGADVESSVVQLGDRTNLFRVRDLESVSPIQEPQSVPLGEGIVPLARLLSMLLAAGYQGDLVVSGLYRGADRPVEQLLEADASYLKRLATCYA